MSRPTKRPIGRLGRYGCMSREKGIPPCGKAIVDNNPWLTGLRKLTAILFRLFGAEMSIFCIIYWAFHLFSVFPFHLAKPKFQAFIMHIRLVFGATLILPAMLSAWAEDSDFAFPLDGSPQSDLSNIPSDPSFESTTSLFDTDIAPSQTLEGDNSPLLGQTEPDSSELPWDDSFQLADCSSSENTLLPALGKSRIRRSDDDSSICTDRDAATSEGKNPSDGPTRVFLMPQMFDAEKHSSTCWEYTLGVLPYAVIASGDRNDEIVDPSRIYNLPLRSSTLSTLYRATVCTRRKPRSPPLLPNFFLFPVSRSAYMRIRIDCWLSTGTSNRRSAHVRRRCTSFLLRNGPTVLCVYDGN